MHGLVRGHTDRIDGLESEGHCNHQALEAYDRRQLQRCIRYSLLLPDLHKHPTVTVASLADNDDPNRNRVTSSAQTWRIISEVRISGPCSYFVP